MFKIYLYGKVVVSATRRLDLYMEAWHHLCHVVNKSSYLLYFNGQVSESVNQTHHLQEWSITHRWVVTLGPALQSGFAPEATSQAVYYFYFSRTFYQ